MLFQPKPMQQIYFHNDQFAFDVHPVAPDFVFGQEGRHGVVYRLINSNDVYFALKVFKDYYRGDWIKANTILLKQYQNLPGMKVADRQVLSRENAFDLLKLYPNLEYSILMPWIDGATCSEIFLRRETLKLSESVALAKRLAEVLSNLEKRKLAHSDISASNVIINIKSLDVNLVGIESCYQKGIVPPRALPLGSSGYTNPRLTNHNQWCESGDRLAGAILISELLCWHDSTIRSIASDESYFSPDEIGEKCVRKDTLYSKLESMNMNIAELFDRAWNSYSFDECPTLELWVKYLSEIM